MHVYLFSPYANAYYILVLWFWLVIICAFFLSALKIPFFRFYYYDFIVFVVVVECDEEWKTTQPAISNSRCQCILLTHFRLYLSIVITCTVVIFLLLFFSMKFMRDDSVALRSYSRLSKRFGITKPCWIEHLRSLRNYEIFFLFFQNILKLK